MHIAAEGGFPKELLQRMQLLEVLAAQPFKLKYNSFTEIHSENDLKLTATYFTNYSTGA
jgi:hypothetical protein